MNRYKFSAKQHKDFYKQVLKGQYWQKKGTPPTGHLPLYEVLKFDDEKQCWVLWDFDSALTLDLHAEYIYNHFEIINMNLDR